MADNSLEDFEKLARFLFGRMHIDGDTLVKSELRKMGIDPKAATQVQYRKAREEVVAESMEGMLTGTNAAEQIAELRSYDEGLFRKLKSIVHKFLNAVRQLYARMSPNSAEGKMVLEMRDSLQHFADLFSEGVKNAAVNRARVEDSAPKKSEVSYQDRISSVVDKAIENKGDIGEKYNQAQISAVPNSLFQMVSASSNGTIDIKNKKIALSGDNLWHEFRRHSDIDTETGRGQIALTPDSMKEAILAIYDPDIVESIFTTKDNPTQRLSFAYSKKTNDGNYVVAEAVGGKNNPNIVPAMIIEVSQKKWERWIGAGKTLGEMLYENDSLKRNSLDIEKIKNNRVIAANFSKNVKSTPHSPRKYGDTVAHDEGESQEFSYQNRLENDSEGRELSAGQKDIRYQDRPGNGEARGLANAPKKSEVSYSERTLSDGTKYVKLDGNLMYDSDGRKLGFAEFADKLDGIEIHLEDGDVIKFVKNIPNKKIYSELLKMRPHYDGNIDIKKVTDEINNSILEVISNSKIDSANEADKLNRHAEYGIKGFDTRKVLISDDVNAYSLKLSIAILNDGTKIGYAKKHIDEMPELWEKIKEAERLGEIPAQSTSGERIAQNEGESQEFSYQERAAAITMEELRGRERAAASEQYLIGQIEQGKKMAKALRRKILGAFGTGNVG